MTESGLLTALLEGAGAKKFRMMAARGLMPLPADEQLRLLFRLVLDPDTEVAAAADSSLRSWPEEDLAAQAGDRGCSPEVLSGLAERCGFLSVLEAIILNPSTPGNAVEKLALRVPATLQEAILLNRVRILEHPGILASLRRNPALSAGTRRLVSEIEAEFFGEKRKDYVVSGGTAPAIGTKPSAEPQVEQAPEDLSLEGLPQEPEAREAAVNERIARMSVRQKIQAARTGPREARAILVRDTNREVARSVLQSPRLTEPEVEAFTAMRSLSEEVLREIGNSREWTRSYTVVHNLVRNPRTPSTIALRLLPRLISKDLLLLSRDRGVTEGVRRTAAKALAQKGAGRPGG